MAHSFFCSHMFLFLKTWGNGWISFGEIYDLPVTCTLVASTSEMLDEDTIFEFTSEPITWLDDCEANAVDLPADIDGLSVTEVTSLSSTPSFSTVGKDNEISIVGDVSVVVFA